MKIRNYLFMLVLTLGVFACNQEAIVEQPVIEDYVDASLTEDCVCTNPLSEPGFYWKRLYYPTPQMPNCHYLEGFFIDENGFWAFVFEGVDSNGNSECHIEYTNCPAGVICKYNADFAEGAMRPDWNNPECDLSNNNNTLRGPVSGFLDDCPVSISLTAFSIWQLQWSEYIWFSDINQDECDTELIEVFSFNLPPPYPQNYREVFIKTPLQDCLDLNLPKPDEEEGGFGN